MRNGANALNGYYKEIEDSDIYRQKVYYICSGNSNDSKNDIEKLFSEFIKKALTLLKEKKYKEANKKLLVKHPLHRYFTETMCRFFS